MFNLACDQQRYNNMQGRPIPTPPPLNLSHWTNQSKGNPTKDSAGKDAPHCSNSSHNHDEQTNNDEQDGQLRNAWILCNFEINLIVHL